MRGTRSRLTIAGMAGNDTKQPPSRAVSDKDRYRPPLADEVITVLVDGEPCPGQVLGRNGPRVHVVFERDGGRYRRWVDASSVTVVDAR